MTSLLSGHTVKTNLKIFCFRLILPTHIFSLPVIILKNVFIFWMSQFLWTILVTLRQICLSNLLTRTNIYWLLVVILAILNEHIGLVVRMSILDTKGRRFEPQHQYVFSLSKRLYPHCFSQLSCEMSTRWGQPREG